MAPIGPYLILSWRCDVSGDFFNNKRGTLDQEDTDMHESGRRILPTQPHMGPGDFQTTCSIEL